MSVRIPAVVAALMLLIVAVSPARHVRAQDKPAQDKAAPAKSAPPKKAPPSKTAEEIEKDEFRAAKRELQVKLRSKQPAERIAALRQLSSYRNVDAARLMVTVGLRDDEPSVRDVAYHLLLEVNDDAEIARYLLVTANKDTRYDAVNPTTLQLLAVLLSSKSPDVLRDTSAFLDKRAGTHDGLIMVETLADELGGRGQAEDVTPLAKLAGLKVFAAEFGLRRAVAEALMKIADPKAIGQLVALLEKVQGEIRAEIVKHLTEVTGQNLGIETVPWREWWKANEKNFQLVAAIPKKEGNDVSLIQLLKDKPKYYGLSIYAQKMVFIIDTSGSMLQGGRLAAAKRELLQAIDGLTDDSQFSVVAFNAEVYPWQKHLVPANASMKHAASQWVDSLDTGTNTASFDALEAGLHFDAEAIFFLTDGVPQGGNINNPADIVNLITRGNAAKRMSIYTIGIGVLGPQGGLFEQFLTALAKRNWGVYRRVDN
jgi:hypothetical protein